MTDAYLRSLGFASTLPPSRAGSPAFEKAWRYEYDHAAVDGAHLFIEHPLGVNACWLSEQELPLTAQEVLARIGLHDRPALEAAMTTFFASHGGIGARLVSSATALRPSRRRQ